jgi:hypothetical protein
VDETRGIFFFFHLNERMKTQDECNIREMSVRLHSHVLQTMDELTVHLPLRSPVVLLMTALLELPLHPLPDSSSSLFASLDLSSPPPLPAAVAAASTLRFVIITPPS